MSSNKRNLLRINLGCPISKPNHLLSRPTRRSKHITPTRISTRLPRCTSFNPGHPICGREHCKRPRFSRRRFGQGSPCRSLWTRVTMYIRSRGGSQPEASAVRITQQPKSRASRATRCSKERSATILLRLGIRNPS